LKREILLKGLCFKINLISKITYYVEGQLKLKKTDDKGYYVFIKMKLQLIFRFLYNVSDLFLVIISNSEWLEVMTRNKQRT
jgi:hypothetical protein